MKLDLRRKIRDLPRCEVRLHEVVKCCLRAEKSIWPEIGAACVLHSFQQTRHVFHSTKEFFQQGFRMLILCHLTRVEPLLPTVVIWIPQGYMCVQNDIACFLTTHPKCRCDSDSRQTLRQFPSPREIPAALWMRRSSRCSKLLWWWWTSNKCLRTNSFIA